MENRKYMINNEMEMENFSINISSTLISIKANIALTCDFLAEGGKTSWISVKNISRC